MTEISCVNGHVNPVDKKQCAICGLPLVEYKEELDLLLKRLRGRLLTFEFSAEKIFVGIGTAGKKIMGGFSSATVQIPRTVYLTFDSPQEKAPSRVKTPQGRAKEYTFKDYPPGGGLYCTVGRRVSMKDEGLEPFLLNAGVSQVKEGQNIIIVAAMGGGTGSGAGPVIVSRCREINPEAHTFAIAITPAKAEANHNHFNAYYGISSLLNFEGQLNVDVIVVLNYDELQQVTGVGMQGEELKLDGLVIALMQMLGQDIGHSGASRVARLSEGLGVQAYVPCLGVGRSMEIFGSLTNILESAYLLPMAPVEKDNILVAYLLIRIPDRLSDVLTDTVINERFDSWAKAKFPNLKASLCLITRLQERTDRVSVCVLLGGDSLDNTLQNTKKGYQEFLTYLNKSGQMEKVGLYDDTIETLTASMDNYNNNLQRLRS